MRKPSWLFGTLCLIGLIIVSLNASPAAAVDNVIFVTIWDDVVADDGHCSLREAIVAANTNTPSGAQPGECPAGSATETDIIVLFSGATYNLTIAGANEDNALTGDLDILNNPNVEIDAHVKVLGEGTPRINASFLNDRVWHVHPGARLVLEQVETFGGSSFLGGGLYNSNGFVTVNNAAFTLNSAYAGGAIVNDGANAVMFVNDTEITRNTANTTHGGGVLNQNGALLYLVRGRVNGNKAADHGGGVANGLDGKANIMGVLLDYNEAGLCGGGVANWGGMVNFMHRSQAVGNSAVQYGGGICNGSGNFYIDYEAVIEANESDYYGGGIANTGIMEIHNSAVRDNKAFDVGNGGGFAGGIYAAFGSHTRVLRSAVTGNTADNSGGGMLAQGIVRLDNSTLSGNFAPLGGGLLVWPFSEVFVFNVTIAANAAVAPNGVGLLQEGGQIIIGNSLLDNSGNCHHSLGTFISQGHNLASDNSCPFTETGDLNNVDPLLADLENGVHQLEWGSPAIDAADTDLCMESVVFGLDQLGQTRPKFNGCDIGAVEWQGFGLYLPVIMR
jgi:CSLREA domain-containing protein